MSTLRQMVQSMTTNRLQYLIKLCAEELQRRVEDAEMKASGAVARTIGEALNSGRGVYKP